VPEGDVVWRTAARLHAALAGRLVLESDLRWPSLATADLSGRTVREAVSRGKHLLIRLDRTGSASGLAAPLTLHSHLRMEGQWRIDATGTIRRTPADARAVLVTREWTATGRRLGMLDLVATADEGTLVGHLGPDLLGPDWSPERALANLSAVPQRTVGEALLDQRNLAGIGTFYLAETLFLLGRTPWTPVAELGPAELARVVDRAHRLLVLNRDRVPQVTTGDARPGHEAFVHGRSGRPCRRCGSMVRVAELGQSPARRVVFYCPTCQRGPAPTDDQLPQRPLGASRRR
jgi:endonuclease-8